MTSSTTRRLFALLAVALLWGWLKGVVLQVVFPPLHLLSELTETLLDFATVPSLRVENARLHQHIDRLSNTVTDYHETLAEVERLRALLDFQAAPPHTTRAAHVIGGDISAWSQRIVLDRGRRDHLMVGLPVVTPAGIVGEIIEVEPSRSFVMLLTDPDFRAGGLIERTRAIGIVRGGLSHCTLTYLDPQSEIRVGDDVVTSGLGGIFPKGLRLGIVTTVTRDPSGLYQTAILQPAAPLGRLEEVLCLLP